jgi:hypothetical protein
MQTESKSYSAPVSIEIPLETESGIMSGDVIDTPGIGGPGDIIIE